MSFYRKIYRCIRRWIQRSRIKRCDHNPPWLVLQSSKEIWWRNIFVLEFCRNPDEKLMMKDGWFHARVAVCTKCGGVLDEITMGYNALGEQNSVTLNYIEGYEKYYPGTGTIYDFR